MFVRGWTFVFSTTPCSNIASLAAGKAETLWGSSCVVVKLYWAINLVACCWLQLGLIVAKATTTATKIFVRYRRNGRTDGENIKLVIIKLSIKTSQCSWNTPGTKVYSKHITVLFHPALLRGEWTIVLSGDCWRGSTVSAWLYLTLLSYQWQRFNNI